MRKTNLSRLSALCTVAAAFSFLPLSGFSQASPYRGLWVGSVSLNAVNEVAVPLDESNIAIAPDPEVPTLTYDRANLRLILHVNGAGQVSLLKDVAILNRNADPDADPLDDIDDLVASESDMSLVTDPRIYVDYPPQPAIRIGSAAFDFGDAQATLALDAMVDLAAQEAADYATQPSLDVDTQAEQLAERATLEGIIDPLLEDMVVKADVAEEFSDFLDTFPSGDVDKIVASPSDPVVAVLESNATVLLNQSFYGDSRALEMVNAVVAAVTNAPDAGAAETNAHNTAASFADVDNLYQRFISGDAFGDMILAAAEEAGTAAKAPGATAATIETVLRGIPESTTVLTEAIQVKNQRYDDTRTETAVDAVYAAMAETAFLNAALPAPDISRAVEEAARSELSDMIARYPVSPQIPTIDYTLFVNDAVFTSTPEDVAEAAARAAIEERAENALYTEASVQGAARIAAVTALNSAYSAAARAMRTELPLEGDFAPGEGDPRSVRDLVQASDLGDAGLEGTIILPASHPTNPFRHRRHPDHTRGYDIERRIRIDFDGMTGDPLQPAGYGVDSIVGTYREEIFGLHKPLGPDPENDPIGLKTEGRFELKRISFIDTLNTR